MRKWILIFLSVAGCAQKKAGDLKYLLPWPNSQGVYELQEITISTLASPDELKGAAAEIYAENSLTDSGYEGSVARPRVVQSGDVYIPQDAESSIALAVYAQFERLMQFENILGSSTQISWPRKVGIELHMTGESGGVAHNNAHYFTQLDVIGLLPYSLDKVPFALNHGIVAHEHFHGHFQQVVLNQMLQGVDKTISALETLFYPMLGATATVPRRADVIPLTATKLNNVVMRAWNEGLADFFAGIYTNKPDFFTVSLPSLTAGRTLDVDNHQPMMTAVSLSQQAPTLTPNQLAGEAYWQGTLLARLMYRLSNSGVEAPDVFLKRILGRLSAIPSRVNASYTTKVMDFEAVVPILLEGFPLNKEACAQLAILSKDALNRSFSQCL